MTEPPRRSRPRLVGLVVIAAIAAIGLFLIASLSLDEGDTDEIRIDGAGEVQQLVGGIRQLGARLGSESAPVTLELFSDVQCESCAEYQLATIDPLIADEVRGGDVKLVFRHYSMDPDRATGVGGFGAVAAGLQDHQWQFVELFMRNQDAAPNDVISQPFLDQIANGVLNLNVEQWQRDFNEEEIRETLEADEMAAVGRRLPLEPAVVVTGPRADRELIQSPSLEEIRAAIAEVSG